MDSFDVGRAVETRYKKLGLTQETLSAVAHVSNSTIRNVLRGRVAEARTWPSIERALGWLPGSLDLLRRGQSPEEILPAEAMAAIWLGILRIKNDANVAETIHRYESFADALASDRDHAYGEWGKTPQQLMGMLWTYLRTELSPAEALPLREALRARGMPDLGNPFGKFVRQPLLPREEETHPGSYSGGLHSDDPLALPSYSGGLHSDDPLASPSYIGGLKSDDPLASPLASVEGVRRKSEEEFLEEVASHVGDTHVTLRRLGKEIGVGLVQVKANIPITSTHVYWLTEDDMEVISQAIETQVVQMARSLAHARSQAADRHHSELRQFQEFRRRARRDWYRQAILVKEIARQGMSVDDIAEKLGETPEAVETMLATADSEAP
jgi:transcriptional regulator with XRE-family HTH domain